MSIASIIEISEITNEVCILLETSGISSKVIKLFLLCRSPSRRLPKRKVLLYSIVLQKLEVRPTKEQYLYRDIVETNLKSAEDDASRCPLAPEHGDGNLGGKQIG